MLSMSPGPEGSTEWGWAVIPNGSLTATPMRTEP
jgi:hypothetical protein